MKILLVEDDPGIIHSLTEFLTGEGFSITSVPGQQEAVNAYRSARFDLALIDISLENGDGYAVCRAIKADRDIPVIFLTASGDEASVVTGLDLGADDYIAKPFRPRELVSRIRNTRRRYGDQDHLIAIGDLLFDTDRGIVSRNGEEIPLSALEYRILQVFLLNRGILLSAPGFSKRSGILPETMSTTIHSRSISSASGRRSSAILRSRSLSRRFAVLVTV